MQTPRIGIIIIHLNTYNHTSACLRSLETMTYPNAEIIVVDNGSTDGTGETLIKEFPSVTFIRSEENLGATGGNNLGIYHALANGCAHVLTLNYDALVTPGFLEPLVERLLSDDSIGSVCGKIYYYPPQVQGRDKILWFAGSFQKWHTGFHHVGESEEDCGQYDTPRLTAYTVGTVMLMRGETIQTIGALADEYFVYWEEADWCWHAREAGYESWYEPRSVIYHNFRSALPGKESAFYMYMQTRNSFIFARHYYHGLLKLRYCFFYPIYLAYRWLYVLRAGNRTGAKALLRGVRDYFRGDNGKKRLKEYGYIK